MLHILLLILKIFGIILIVILGILLLLLSIVLFVPIRYEISAKCDGTIDSLKVKGKVTWLLHLLRADLFVKGKKLKWQIRAAWIKKSSALAFGERKEEVNHEPKENKSTEKVSKVEKTIVKDKIPEEITEGSEEKCESDSGKNTEHRLEQTNDEGSKTDKTLIEKIKKTIKNFCDKIKDLLQKTDKITEFLTDESHVRAFEKVKKSLFVLLKRLKPKKIDVKLHFGFEDPATTGKVLAVFGVLYPFLEDTAEIIPNFEKQILEGKVYLKGGIRLSCFVWMVLKLLLSKDIRKSYKDIRNFKL